MGINKPIEDDSSLTVEQIDMLIKIERTGAGLSMVAIVLTVILYLRFRRLRTTPNLFLVFASVANAGASVASMMGYDGVNQGEGSALCQTQAFIFEWFMQADPWWSCAMAVNVFLVFFNNADPAMFRQYTWIYCIICFGGPMIPAVVLVSIRGDTRGNVFGDAALWCWIGSNWSVVRLYAYYIPIWICILLSIFIYIAVGYHVFHHRNQLRNAAAQASNSSHGKNTSRLSSEAEDSAEEGLMRQRDYYGLAVTEVQISLSNSPSLTPCDRGISRPATAHLSEPQLCDYSWLETPKQREHQLHSRGPTQQFETLCTSDNQRHKSGVFNRLGSLTATASMKLRRLDPVKMAYLRTSFVFGLSVLITWIPSSVNRLYSLANDGRVSFPLSMASGCVLPLQGVWNMIIFVTTSWSAVRAEARALKMKYAHGVEYPRNTRLGSRLEIVCDDREHISKENNH